VGDLGELATLIRVKVDVVNVERGRNKSSRRDTITDGVDVGENRGLVKAEVAEVVELKVDTNLVVLESNERKCKTRVAVEPELKRDVECVLRCTLEGLVGGVGLTTCTVIITVLSTLDEEIDKLGDIANHLGITSLLTGLLCKLIPDLEPVTVVLINALTTYLKLNVLDQVVTDPVEPAELGTRAVRGLESYLRKSGLEVNAVDQITVTLDSAGDLATEARRTVKRVLNGLHREVRVSAVHDLEECDLWVTC